MKKILLLLIIFLLTGCYDYNELTDLGIVSSMLVDYKNDEYVVNVEVLDTNDQEIKPSYFIEGKGDTFNEALNDLYTKSTKHIYLNHINAVILSKIIAQDKLTELYDYFWRAPYIRKDSLFVITDEIERFLTFESADKMAIGESIKSIIRYNLEENGNFKTSKFNDILNCYLNDENYFLGEIYIDDNMIKLGDVYLVEDDKLNLNIDSDAILLSNLLDGEITSFTISGKNTYEIYKYKVDKKVKEDSINLNFKFDVRLKNINTVNVNTNSEIKEVESHLNERLTTLFENSIEYSKNLDKDIYNFNYLYYLYYPKKVDDNTWKKLNYSVKAITTINEKGLLIGSLESEENER